MIFNYQQVPLAAEKRPAAVSWSQSEVDSQRATHPFARSVRAEVIFYTLPESLTRETQQSMAVEGFWGKKKKEKTHKQYAKVML